MITITGSYTRSELIDHVKSLQEANGPTAVVEVNGQQMAISELLHQLTFEPNEARLHELLGDVLVPSYAQLEDALSQLTSAYDKIGGDIEDLLSELQELNYLLSKAKKQDRDAFRDTIAKESALQVAEMRESANSRFTGAMVMGALQIVGGLIALKGAADSASQLSRLKSSSDALQMGARIDLPDGPMTPPKAQKLRDEVDDNVKISEPEKKALHARIDLQLGKAKLGGAEDDLAKATTKLDDAQANLKNVKDRIKAELDADPKIAQLDGAIQRRQQIDPDDDAIKGMQQQRDALVKQIEGKHGLDGAQKAADDAAVERHLANQNVIAQKKEVAALQEKADRLSEEADIVTPDMATERARMATTLAQAYQQLFGALGTMGNASLEHDAAMSDAQSKEHDTAANVAKSLSEDAEDARRELRDFAQGVLSALKEKAQMDHDTMMNIYRRV